MVERLPRVRSVGYIDPMPDGRAEIQVTSRWIKSATFDASLLIGAPLVWLVISLVVVALGIEDTELHLPGFFGQRKVSLFPAFAITFTMAHVSAVFFRSHARPEIFKLTPWRFTVVPIALFAIFAFSKTAFLFGLVFATWFDNWHSSLQTFGIGRIYDMRAGNHAEVGRRLDIGLALVTFLGPILAGASLAQSFYGWERFSEVGLVELTRVPGWVLAHQLWLTVPIFVVGLAYCAFYLVSYVRLARAGYKVSKQKVALWLILALTSLWMWGFDSFGQAFLVMESFHSTQYFALLWWSERKNIEKRFHTEGRPLLTLAILLGLPFAFGLWCSVIWRTHVELALFLVVELMHYWWDGFIWSVRKKQV